jgi:PIN domain nuclease of toxin-antitoxin system
LIVLDASALLAFLVGEADSDLVESALVNDATVVSAVNWSETAQKSVADGRDWESAKALLSSYGLAVEPVTEADADWAARRWMRGEALSIADRLCLALGARLNAEVWTADKGWGDAFVRTIR